MANENLKGKKVAILVTDGFEQVELLQPREALNKAGAETKVVSLKEGPVKGWDMTNWGKEIPADQTLDNAKSDDFDALLLPGGVINPDKLRMEPKAVAFVKSFFDAGKPVAAARAAHGPARVCQAGRPGHSGGARPGRRPVRGRGGPTAGARGQETEPAMGPGPVRTGLAERG